MNVIFEMAIAKAKGFLDTADTEAKAGQLTNALKTLADAKAWAEKAQAEVVEVMAAK